ncbi:MAG: hypothetical protein HGA19_23870 [Oscillochloris sp.]|nr:hypothetical protein [Oscillochloris sp.]
MREVWLHNPSLAGFALEDIQLNSADLVAMIRRNDEEASPYAQTPLWWLVATKAGRDGSQAVRHSACRIDPTHAGPHARR